jgi:hypothetical protein
MRIPVIHTVEGHQVGLARDVDDLEADLLVVRLQVDRSFAVLSGLRGLQLLGQFALCVHADERCLACVARAHHIHFESIV